jgi:hypothetical protein
MLHQSELAFCFSKSFILCLFSFISMIFAGYHRGKKSIKINSFAMVLCIGYHHTPQLLTLHYI